MRRSRDADPTHHAYLARRKASHRGFDRTSRYLVMRDGTRIAIDVCLPRGLRAGDRIPTIVRQTRYFRRFDVARALRPFLSEATLDPMNAATRRLFTSRGYAWIDVDARGSGASFGERPCPWWLEGEVADGAEIVDWIVKQPWSSGKVGATGVSYEGTTAEFLAITQHPAVKAIAPRFSLFDIYADVAFPGGLHNAYFTHAWETANAALDRNAPGEMVGLMMALRARGMANASVVSEGSPLHRAVSALDRPLTQAALRRFFDWTLGGVAPVDDDVSRGVLGEALRAHTKNHYVHDGAVEITYRDDAPKDSPIPGQTQDGFSPHTYVERIRDAGVAVLGYGGWFDGGYAGAATKRHAALAGGGRLLVGPWGHGGQLDLDPDAPNTAATFDHAAELLRFFDPLLAPEHAPRAMEPAPVRYFLMGDGSWRTSSTWPPEGTHTVPLYFAADRKLAGRPGAHGVDVHEIDPTAGAGTRTRWRTLLCPWLHADGRGRSPSGWLVYETDPLEADLVLTGSPLLVLSLAASEADGAIVAHLEDVDREGTARLFTEGTHRLLHTTRLLDEREGSPRVEASYRREDALGLAAGQLATHAIELLPTAMLVRRGHRLRLVLGGADVDHFTSPTAPRVTWTVHLAGSRLLLPVARR